MEITTVEQTLINHGQPTIAELIKHIRTNNQPSPWLNIANQLNLPWLFFASEFLHRKHRGRKIVFLGRDCQLMERVYKAFFMPWVGLTSYLPFSRKVALEQREAAIGY